MPYDCNLNKSGSNSLPHHRRYHEICGHVYSELSMRNIVLIEKMLESLLSKHGDREIEGLIGVVGNLKSMIEMSRKSFSYGGVNAFNEGSKSAKRQINFAFEKIQAKRLGWSLDRYHKEGNVHLTVESLNAIQCIIEYQDEIDGSLDYYDSKF